MKQLTGPRLLMLIGIMMLILFNSCSSGKQVSSAATPLELMQAINNDQWIFLADHASPVYGRSRSLTGSYFVKCNRHELTVALPYYGQLTSPSGSYGTNPLDFHSAQFKLSKVNEQNSKWTVTIESPNPEVRSMMFSFYDNGNAQLSVTMTNRSAISFTGAVSPS